ncbi:hypothetical protein ACLOJK_003607 [Asimina triloba]
MVMVLSLQIWPPKSIKDSGSRLHSKLKEAIIQFNNSVEARRWPQGHKSGLEKNLLGSHLVSLPVAESRSAPPAFASDPLMNSTANESREGTNANSFESIKDPSFPSSSAAKEENYLAEGYASKKYSSHDIVEVDGGSNSSGNQYTADHDSSYTKTLSPTGPGATTRKGAHYGERQNSEISYYADDEDGNRKKYTRRENITQIKQLQDKHGGCTNSENMASKKRLTANFWDSADA